MLLLRIEICSKIQHFIGGRHYVDFFIILYTMLLFFVELESHSDIKTIGQSSCDV